MLEVYCVVAVQRLKDMLANSCMWNYTSRHIAPVTKFSIGIVRFTHLNSLLYCVMCTSNMAEWLSMTSLHRMYKVA